MGQSGTHYGARAGSKIFLFYFCSWYDRSEFQPVTVVVTINSTSLRCQVNWRCYCFALYVEGWSRAVSAAGTADPIDATPQRTADICLPHSNGCNTYIRVQITCRTDA